MSKIKQYFYDLFWSLFKTKNLFKFAIYSCITPIIILCFILGMFTIPSIITYNSITVEDITNNVAHLDKVVAHALSQDIKCSIGEQKLNCEEGYSYETLYEFQNDNNDTIKYKIFVNSDISGIDFKTGKFGQHYDTDNYLIFFETTFVYRYTYHSPKDESVTEYNLYGFYDNLEGMNLHNIYEESLTKDDSNSYLIEKGKTIILDGYKAVAYEAVFTDVVANFGIYLLFMLIVALLIKGNYMLKRKKGFKYSQALKIGIVSSLQSTLIALVISLLRIDFFTILGLAIVVRILYIYIKYTGSKKNTEWLEEMHEYTKDERFNP